MKHLLILISLLLLSSPVIGNSHKGETLFRWENPSGDGYVWKGFGDKETHPKYTGDVKNGKPDGLGYFIWSYGEKYIGSWKNGLYHGKGTFTQSNGTWYKGEYKNGKGWNGIYYDKDGKIKGKYVNGKEIEQ